MTSRTPMGVQPPRPPQRSLSSGLTVQRPPHQRALSAQYLPQSPIRRDNLIDLTADANDAAVAQNRYGTMPRRGGSRLKLELSSDASSGAFQPVIADSPQTLTPSRIMPKNDSSSAADMNSPASNRALPITDSDNPPMPMPKRRQRFTVPTAPQTPVTPAVATKKDSRPKPYAVEVPPAAPRYAPLHKKPDNGKSGGYGSGQPARETQEMGHADFFPWTGNHAEDQLSDTIVKQGFFDKAPVTQAETTSAKSAIFPALKHKNGLHLLSSIFIGVMGQRKHNGQVTAPSAFKPPPRVTLTDTKREVWMRDLANPAISLRRLSRTIPHGIRGKGLLDHCLNKNVPTERAVWLVRCVGANDLRTVKRKGVNGAVVMGGETKWLKDWTIFVEQFVESVTSAFGDADWKAKFQYAVRLATHLYAECLVDRDHYMDWLVSGLENANQTKLPMWILISQIYWKDLLRLRKYGRRLVGALLTQLNAIYQDPDRDILSQLSDRLSSLLTTLLINSPDNFISPTTWLKCREALSASIPINNDTARAAYNRLNLRNEQLLASSSKSQPANRQILIKHLDSTLQTLYTNELSSTCWVVSDDKRMIMRTVIEWCTSYYRPGQAKVYVAASLLRSWANMNMDTTRAILDFLDASPPQEATSKRWFYHLVSELSRSGHFSTHSYTLWLISRGGVRSVSDTEPDAPCMTRLLVELPLHGIDASFKETRAQLLRRASFDVSDEANDIATALKVVQHALGIPLDPQDAVAQRKPMALHKICRAIGNSSRTLQTEVGLQLMHLVRSEALHISSNVFSFVRSVLLAAADFTTMAHVIKVAIKSSDAELLASCADTVNVHLPVFAAIGVARDLCDMLLDRLKAISDEHGSPARPLLVALGSLTAQVPGLSNTAAHLRRDLQQIDRHTAIDACSPVSDNMPLRLQDAESELAEEIEKLLISGNSVDRPTMDRLFHTIVSRLESCWTTAPDKQRAFGALLARLRIFDRQHFDVRMTDWVHHVSSLTNRPSIAGIYAGLISLGCLSFSTIFTTTNPPDVAGFASAPISQGSKSTYMQEILQLITLPLPLKAAVTPEEGYRFYIEQRLAPQKHHKELVTLVRNALLEYSKLQQQHADLSESPLSRDDVRNQMLELLRMLILADSQSTAQILGLKLPDSRLVPILANITTRLLAPARDPDAPMTFETVLEMANDFALPFCQLKLSIGLASNRTPNPVGNEEQQPSQVDMLSKALNQAVDTKNMMWTSILPYLSDEITEHLKRQTQSRFLSLFPSLKASETAGPASQTAYRLTASLLSVVESIIQGRPALKTSQLNPMMVDKLTELWEILASTDSNKEFRRAVLQHWLPALLKFITLHTTANEVAPPSTPAANNMKPPVNAVATETRARMLVVLAGLALELQGLSMEEANKYGELGEAVLDLAMLLVDNLPEEARQQCVRLVISGATSQGSGSTDTRLQYLFSSSPLWKEQFMLAHRQTQPSVGTPRMRTHISVQQTYKLTPYIFRKWELLSEPSPVVGENDTALSLTLFEAIKIQ